MFKKKKEEILAYPTHIAFIMDGNRRWAKERGLNKMLGHKQGAVAMKNIVFELEKIAEIKYASFFAFSTENWKREQSEIDYIFDLVRQFANDNEQEFDKRNIKVVFMGDLKRFPQDLQKLAKRWQNKKIENANLTVNLAINYGGRDDIVQAANKVAATGQKITVQNLAENLYSAPCPDIDFLIRTSGEQRVSNFMLYQMAYSEFYFPKVHWPDFDKKELNKALIEFGKRNRRFGGK